MKNVIIFAMIIVFVGGIFIIFSDPAYTGKATAEVDEVVSCIAESKFFNGDKCEQCLEIKSCSEYNVAGDAGERQCIADPCNVGCEYQSGTCSNRNDQFYAYRPDFAIDFNFDLTEYERVFEDAKELHDECNNVANVEECVNNKLNQFNARKFDYAWANQLYIGKKELFYSISEFLENCINSPDSNCICKYTEPIVNDLNIELSYYDKSIFLSTPKELNTLLVDYAVDVPKSINTRDGNIRLENNYAGLQIYKDSSSQPHFMQNERYTLDALEVTTTNICKAPKRYYDFEVISLQSTFFDNPAKTVNYEFSLELIQPIVAEGTVINKPHSDRTIIVFFDDLRSDSYELYVDETEVANNQVELYQLTDILEMPGFNYLDNKFEYESGFRITKFKTDTGYQSLNEGFYRISPTKLMIVYNSPLLTLKEYFVSVSDGLNIGESKPITLEDNLGPVVTNLNLVRGPDNVELQIGRPDKNLDGTPFIISVLEKVEYVVYCGQSLEPATFKPISAKPLVEELAKITIPNQVITDTCGGGAFIVVVPKDRVGNPKDLDGLEFSTYVQI